MEGKYSGGEQMERIENNFKYHPPKDDQPKRYEMLRDAAKKLAILYATNAPASRELSLALTALEESVYHVNAAIARNE